MNSNSTASKDLEEIIGFLFRYQYDLIKVPQKDKDFVVAHKRNAIDLNEVPPNEELRQLLNLLYPGFIYTDREFYTKYRQELYDRFFSLCFTPPRGFVDPKSVVVVGIAPGESKKSFSESNWLFGPSSKTLHSMLTFNQPFYFTNICKEPFSANVYTESHVNQFYFLALNELQFFRNNKIIFLGRYDVYDDLIKELKLKSCIKVRHPSYFRYTNSDLIQAERLKIMELIYR